MAYAAFTIRMFGIYLLGLGAVLLTAPNLLLGLFGLPPANDVWIHVVGMLVGFLGFYYVRAAIGGLTAFFRWTVPVRLSVLVFFGAFVVAGLAPPVLLLFAAVDAMGALWTWHALRNRLRG
ncbi:MAG: hypothetical protein ACM32F_11425 [Betaproteobacteria bacterium]